MVIGDVLGVTKGGNKTDKKYIETTLYLMCCVLSFPACYVFQFLKSPSARLWYSIIMGIFLNFTCYRKNIIHFFLQMVLTKIALHLGDHFKIKNIAYYIFLCLMTHLSCVHFYIMYNYYGYWGADLTAYVMIMCSKMSSLGYLY
jgi:uncharacterized membrane protein AbrB (regulator of aidB expression)